MTTEILWCETRERFADRCIWSSTPHDHVPMLLVRKDAAVIDLELTGQLPPFCDWYDVLSALAAMPPGRYVRVDQEVGMTPL